MLHPHFNDFVSPLTEAEVADWLKVRSSRYGNGVARGLARPICAWEDAA